MEGIFTVSTGLLTGQRYAECFEDTLTILRLNNINEVELYFGSFWGDDYRNWTPFDVAIDLIQNEIDEAENIKAGRFGNDDLFISLNHLDMEILFSHESTISLDYYSENVIVSQILNMFDQKKIATQTKKNEFPRLNSWRPPDLLQNEKFDARLVSTGRWMDQEGKVKIVQIFSLNYDFYYEYKTMYNYENQHPVLNKDGEQFVLWWNESSFFSQKQGDGIEFPGSGGLTVQEAKEAAFKSIGREIQWDNLS